MAQAARGEPEAQHWLVKRLLPRMRTTVTYLAHQSPDAEDMVQRALVEILRSAPTFRGESSIETWAERIAVRVTFRALKRLRRSSATMDLVDELPEPSVPIEESDPAARIMVRRRLAQLLQLDLAPNGAAEVSQPPLDAPPRRAPQRRQGGAARTQAQAPVDALAPASSSLPLAPSPGEPAPTADALLRRAFEARAKKEWRLAAELYEEVIRSHRGSAAAQAARVSLGNLLIDQLGRPKDGLAWCRGYTNPTGVLAVEALLCEVRGFQALGETANEKEVIERFLARWPDDFNAASLRDRLKSLEKAGQ